MTTYNLNLTTNYCDHWGLWEAVREILQNGEDQLTLNPENEIDVDYNKSTKILTISNKDSILNRSSLLFGGSTKKDDENTIGKFGEGYKIALLIFQKLGLEVVIKNYAKNERWTTEMLPDSKYDGAEVLKVKIKKYRFRRLPDHNLSFEIKGITEEQWAEIQSKYLREQEVGETFKASSKNEILFNPSLRGKVFINGLFVEKLKGDYLYGYNFHPSRLKLDRDRQSVAGFSFEFALNRLFEEFSETSKENASVVLDLIRSDNRDLSSNSEYIHPTKSLIEVAEEKLKKYGSYSFPVTSQEEAQHLIATCPMIKPIFLSKAEKKILSRLARYETVEQFVKHNEELKKHLKELTPEQHLIAFLEQNKNVLYINNLENAFKDLIEKSKEWYVKEQEPELKENEVVLEETEITEETFDSQEIIQKVDKESLHPSYFDDDIPF